MVKRTRPRIAASVSQEAHDALGDMSRRYFGGTQSSALDWAVRLAAVVLADPATRVEGIGEPEDSLRLWTGGKL